MEKYRVGDWVICISVTPENHEGLRVNGYYEVIGATLVDGNLVYTVTDCEGDTRFSIGDRFRKYTREDFFTDDFDMYRQKLYPENVETEHEYIKAYSENDEIALENLALSLDDVFLTIDPSDPVDMVNHPPHYNHGGIESLDIIRMCLTKKEFKGYLKGQVLKYRERAPYKGNSEQDYAKAKFYYDMLMEMKSKKQGGK